MAEEAGQDRTEPASPRRREELRKQGQVAFSPDLGGGLLLLAAVVMLLVLGPDMMGMIRDTIRSELSHCYHPELGTGEAEQLLSGAFVHYVRIVGLFFGALLVVAFFAGVVQVGFHITPERLELNFDKINPVTGLGKLFSLAALVKGFFAILKIVALSILVYLVVRSRSWVFPVLSKGGVGHAAAQGWTITIRLALYLAAAFALLGIADFVYQKMRFEKSIRMTKQELKEELKREEGDPQLKVRRRQLHRENLRRKMLAEVPKATVVITNPTHVAIAVYYERGKVPAPRVLAKGVGVLAKRIVELARNHAVPVVERAPLARALYRAVDIEREIPPQLFQAVAEVLVFIYRLRNGAHGAA
jgi:flagellar biosynthetic protein FlhB